MKGFWKIPVLFLCVLLFAGCEKKPGRPSPVVTDVQITCRHAGQVIRRNYTDPEKVRYVLYYLRNKKTKGWARTDPERIVGDDYRIDVHFSDGSSRIYRQRANRFFSKDWGRWKNVDEAWARRLYYLLYAVESDPVANPPGN